MIGTATIAIALLCILSDLTMITMLVHEHLTKTTGRAGGQRGHLLDLLADGGASGPRGAPDCWRLARNASAYSRTNWPSKSPWRSGRDTDRHGSRAGSGGRRTVRDGAGRGVRTVSNATRSELIDNPCGGA